LGDQTLNRLYRTFLFSVAVALGAAVFPIDAYAYLDPGTGSLFVQSLIAGIAAVGYALRLYWGRIRALLRRSGDRVDSQSDSPPVQGT
jgi:hypothetical protein